MWIRSQDRNRLINESYFRIYKERKEYSICSRVEALGTYILPNVNYNEMLTMVNIPQTVVPRTTGIPQATVNGQVPPVRPF